MSRRTDLLQQLIQSDKWGEEKENEQKFLAATAELILTDLINIAMNGVQKHGAGSLIINLQNDSTKSCLALRTILILVVASPDLHAMTM